MQIAIIAIGDELTSGRILNTTSNFAARQLFDAGYDIYGINTIGDAPELIGEVLKRAITEVDAILVTGGLGSTDDDMTNEAVSHALDLPTQPNLEILSIVRNHFDKITDVSIGQLDKLGWLPEGAEALAPHSGMAGYQIVYDNTPIFFLPGIPSQMQKLLVQHVLPRLATWNNKEEVSTYQRIFRIFNLPETGVNRRINKLHFSDDVHIGYYPVFPEVHLTLLIRDTNPKTAKRLFDSSCRAITTALGDHIYAYGRDSMERVVGKLLLQKGMKLAVAESCTGGLISEKITDIPGSSEYFLGGIIVYANSLKESLLDVSPDLIKEKGAVSREVAENMAYSVLEKTKADISIAITGYAGPTDGGADNPVGTVFVAISTPQGDWVNGFNFEGNRQEIRELAAQNALDLLRRYLIQDI